MRAKAAPALVRYGSTLNLPRILSLNTNDEGREKMSKYKKLKPCPFCGGKSKIVQCDDEGNVRGEEYESNPWSGLGYRVVHESDDCPISTGEDAYNLIYDSREEAESHWNRRADGCDRDELFNIANDIDRIANNASTDSIGIFLQVSTIRPASIKAIADRIRKALEVE